MWQNSSKSHTHTHIVLGKALVCPWTVFQVSLYLTSCIDYQENKISVDDGAHLTGKIKNGWHSLPCIFCGTGLFVSVLFSAWVKTNRQCSQMWHATLRTNLVHRSGLAVPLQLPSISSSLYFSQMPPTHSLTPTQVKRKTFTTLQRLLSQPLITEPWPKCKSPHLQKAKVGKILPCAHWQGTNG